MIFNKHYEDNWRDDISCRFWYALARLCKRTGGHRWSKRLTYEVGAWGRSCRLCGTFRSEDPPFTSGTTATQTHLTIYRA